MLLQYLLTIERAVVAVAGEHNNYGARPEISPAFDENYTQELVLLCHIQRTPFVWMSFHEHRQFPSGLKMVRNSRLSVPIEMEGDVSMGMTDEILVEPMAGRSCTFLHWMTDYRTLQNHWRSSRFWGTQPHTKFCG